MAGTTMLAEAYVLDSCSHYAAADAGLKYAVVQGTPGLVPGRTAGSALSYDGGGNSTELDVGVASTAIRAGAWGASVYVHSAGWGATSSIALLQLVFDDGAGVARHELTQLRVTAEGAVAVTDPGSVVVQSANGTLPFDGWHFVEVAIHLGEVDGIWQVPDTGQCLVRVDGVDVAAAAGVQLAPFLVTPSTTLRCNRLRYGNQDGGNTVRVDLCDIYGHTYRGTVASGNDFATRLLGYRPVRAYWPTSAVDPTPRVPSTPVGAATPLECVDDPEIDQDTTYATWSGGPAASQRDLYAFSGLTVPTTAATYYDTLGSAAIDTANNAQINIVARGDADLAGVRGGVTGIEPLALVEDTTLQTFYTTVRGQALVRPASFGQNWYYEPTGTIGLRVTQFVVELRQALVARGRTWVTWLE